MPFSSLCSRMLDDVFPKDGRSDLSKWKFFEFNDSDYKRTAESAEVVRIRTNPNPESDDFNKRARTELKFGWICGMARDRSVQERMPTYCELIRNNGMLAKNVHVRLEAAKTALEE